MTDERWAKRIAEAARDEDAAPVAEELARPLDAGEMAALAAKLSAALPERNVVPLRAVPRRRWAWASAVAASIAAAAIALLVFRAGSGGAALPAYGLWVEGSDGLQRGAEVASPEAVIHRSPDGRLALVVRPRDPSSARADVRVMLDASSQLRDWPVQIQRSAEGAFRIVAEQEALGQVPGSARVIVFIAEPSRLPADEAAAKRALAGEAPDVQVKIVRLDVTR
jgi:hypothetical protein